MHLFHGRRVSTVVSDLPKTCFWFVVYRSLAVGIKLGSKNMYTNFAQNWNERPKTKANKSPPHKPNTVPSNRTNPTCKQSYPK